MLIMKLISHLQITIMIISCACYPVKYNTSFFKKKGEDVYSMYYFDQHLVIHGEMDIRWEIQGKQMKACSIVTQ